MEAFDILLTTQKLKRLYKNQFTAMKQQWGLTQNEVDVLLFLANNPGCDTARHIIELRGLSKSQVSQSVEGLVARGFLHTVVDKADRRCVHLSLCGEGVTLARQAQAAQEAYIRLLQVGMSAEEKEALRNGLKKLLENAEGATEHVV